MLNLFADPPILANPKLVNNATHLILLWSPPFIWPGHRIAYYNISVTERNEGSISHYRVNSSVDHSNPTVSFANKLYRTETLMCTELYFCISPITTSNYTLVEVCNSSDSSLPLCECICTLSCLVTSVIIKISWHSITENWVSFISCQHNCFFLIWSNTSTLCSNYGKCVLWGYYYIYMYVLENMQLPCSHQMLNYTITVENKEGHFTAQLGPTPSLGACIVRELITSNLETNESYSLEVRMDSHSRTAKSDKYFFSKCTHLCNTICTKLQTNLDTLNLVICIFLGIVTSKQVWQL